MTDPESSAILADLQQREYRLAVLGSPIAHSQSPALHQAAYDRLGLPWRYERVEVDEHELAFFLDSCGPDWRGLSLTMPLKERVLDLVQTVDPLARTAAAANTVLFGDQEGSIRTRAAFNTDVAGIARALADAGVATAQHAWLLGAGATAHSALIALARSGSQRVDAIVRAPERAAALVRLGLELGITVAPHRGPGDAARSGAALPDVVISTLPGGIEAPWDFTEQIRRHALLFDVAYDPWPSALATAWQQVGGTVASGLGMLVHQALAQVRIFVGGAPDRELVDEPRVLEAMWSSVGQEDARPVPDL